MKIGLFSLLCISMNAVHTSDLTKHFRSGAFKRKNIAALEKVSLQVNAGEIFGLLGPNGAGKTTFIKLLLSISHPTSGTAEVFGLPLGARALREKCGYLPESHQYPGFLTGLETLIFFGRLNGLRQSELKPKANALLEKVGLAHWAHVKTKRYSKGMLQRLGLAQALINDPQILFLDEPTDGVDPIGRKEIRDLLISLKEKGTTIFLNSHLLSEVEMISDRVAILNKGRIARTGTITDLTAQSLSYSIRLAAHVPEEILGRLRSTFPDIRRNDKELLVALKDKIELNIIIDTLRTAGIGIEGLTQQKASLEDLFIEAIKGDTAV
jgi:ABC-2 type transport system ATP-binding protein